MRARILQTLEFPRSLAREHLELENCSHSGNFSPFDPICAECASRLECSWLYHNDEYSGLGNKPMGHLQQALEFAVDYVDALSFRAGHRPKRNCRCETCAWLSGARQLLEKIRRTA